VDTLCGATLLTISILSAVTSQLSSVAVTMASQQLSTAATDLEVAMESLLALPTAETPTPGSEFEADQPVVRFANLNLPDQSLTATYPGYTPGGPVPNPIVVVLTMTWTDPKGRPRELRARTVKLQ